MSNSVDITITVDVTAEDIAESLANGGRPCPLMVAASRAFGRPMLAGYGTLIPRVFPSDSTDDAPLPEEARDWIRRFELQRCSVPGVSVGPIRFEVKPNPAWANHKP